MSAFPTNRLPSFEEIRREAYRLLGDAEDVLRSDWPSHAGPTDDQGEHLHEARRLIAQAKTALNRAAR